MAALTQASSERRRNLSDSFLKQRGDVHSTALEGESVLLNLSTGRYYTLNAVGSVVWDQCAVPRSIAQILSTIFDRFEVTTQQAHDDLVDLVSLLTGEKLIQTERR
ncbi:MAG: PqqD family protein [Nitrospira sp.]|nr:PqqD family protein [Nitrospira sp.]